MKYKAGKGDKLDKYRRWIRDGLAPKDVMEKDPEGARMWARMIRAWGLLSFGFTHNQIVAQLRDDPSDPVRESQGYATVRDSLALYGSLTALDRDGMRLASAEYYRLLSQMARKNGDLKSAIRAQELADKLFRLFNPDDTSVDISDYVLPSLIEYSTDPKQLKAQQAPEVVTPPAEPETIDVEFEEDGSEE